MTGIKTTAVHFSVYPPGIVNLARQMYHFEGKKDQAKDILRCFGGITEEQVDAILKGDATINEDYHFKSSPDMEFKTSLVEHQKYLDSRVVVLAGYKVPKELLDPYAEHIVKRLRQTAQMYLPRSGIRARSFEEIEDVVRLEEMRRELHEQIVKAVGAGGDINFSLALSEYLDKVAGAIFPPELPKAFQEMDKPS